MLITDVNKFIKRKKGAVHVGAHDGEERFWYKENGFCHVVWFEPNPVLFRRLYKNLENYPDNIAYNIGVHDGLTHADLKISNNDGQSSSILELGTHKIHHPNVSYIDSKRIRLMRLDTFFEKFHINYSDYNFLNIDVQGVELNVLRSAGNLLNNFEYIYLEVNVEEVYKGCALLSDIDAYLETYDFNRIATKITRGNWGDAFYVKTGCL